MRTWYSKKYFGLRISKRTIVVGIGTLLTLFMTISLISHHAYDATFLYYTSEGQLCANWGGPWGATLAAFLLYLMGGSSLFIVVMSGLLLYGALYNRSFLDVGDRLGALVLGMFTTATLSWIYSRDLLESPVPGGYLGCILYRYLYAHLGSATFFCLYIALVISCILTVRFSSLVAVARIIICGTQRGMRYARKKSFVVMIRRCWYHVTNHIKKRALGVASLVRPLIGSESREYMVWEYEVPTESMPSIATDVVWQGVLNKVQPSAESLPSPTNVISDLSSSSPSQQPTTNPYVMPELTLFNITPQRPHAHNDEQVASRARVLEEKLARFGIEGRVVAIKHGPVVTLFEYKPAIDSKISKIVALEDDLALALQALSIRIIAPIPGTSVVGFEVANAQRASVMLADTITSSMYRSFSGALPLILGKDTLGEHVVVDLASMPHLLVAGSTGSGKSVALNSMLVSLLCKCTPDELKLVLIDPKRLEFAPYADIAHLLFPIVTQPKQAAPVLQWVVQEMEKRYSAMAECGARTIADYNKMVLEEQKKPYIVVIIDELADLMMTTGKEIETLIARIAQMARAAGIHMIVATQRPSVDVITGLIKVNFPSRISFRVISKVDSRTILDCAGADKLLGKGDMLFLDATQAMLKRVHGAYVSDKEIAQLITYIRNQRRVNYLDPLEYLSTTSDVSDELQDALYNEVVAFLQEIDEVSISLLQRKFRIGYNRSARIIELLESRGLVLPSQGGKIRKVVR